MKSKKHLALCLCVAMMLSTFTLGVASCNDDKDSSNSSTEMEYGEEGVYSAEATVGGYSISLDGTSFTLSLDGAELTGTYTYDGATLYLSFADQTQTASATLSNNVVTLTYNGNTYTLMRSYTVTYVANGGSAVAAETALHGKTLARPEDPTKDGCLFVGWYVDEQFKTPYIFGETAVTGDLTLYARYITAVEGQNEFTAKFVVDGADYATQETIGGQLFDLPTPTKDGATFAGWWTSDYEDETKLTCKYDGQTLTQHTTLYAVWESAGPLVSVTGSEIKWTAKGVNNSYEIQITAPDGTTETKSSNVSRLEYDFASKAEGDYVINVKMKNETTTVYYKNKALAKVSLFEVVDQSVLVFNAVENAEKYLLTIDCGNDDHEHTELDIGNVNSFDFAACEMQTEGISFSVKAVADGYIASESETYVLCRNLDALTGLTIDETTEVVSWNAVENATSYVLEITAGGVTDKITVENATSYDLKSYMGTIDVKVQPVAHGYNAPEAVSVSYNKMRLASPSNIRLKASTIEWNAVNGATKYLVKIGDNEYETTTNEFEMKENHYDATQESCEVSVKAIAAWESANSLYSNVVTVRFGTMSDNLIYANGKVAWEPVINVSRYEVKVNDGEAVEVASSASEYEVTLTQGGENTVSVRCYNAAGEPSDWVSVAVNAYEIKFDACGGEELSSVFKASGDPLVVSTTTTEKEGYDFAGWYNVPNGGQNNGQKLEDGTFKGITDTTLYAYWTPKTYTITLVGDEYATPETTEIQVRFGEAFELPVLKSSDEKYFFKGWYKEANGEGTCYANAEGDSVDVWGDAKDMKLYVGWTQPLEYKLLTDGTYSVWAGPDIASVTSVKIPSKYNNVKVTTVEAAAFKSCSKLVSIDIPDTITMVATGANGGNAAGSAFQGCTLLTSVNVYYVEGTHERLWSSIDGVLFYNNEFNGGLEIKYYPYAREGAYTIPDGVVTVPIALFKSCTKLTEITIPASVVTIDANAFQSCSKLEKINFATPEEGTEAKALTINGSAFKSCSSLLEVTLPTRLKGFDLTVFDSCSKLANIYIAEGESSVGFKSIDGMLCNEAGDTIVYVPKGKEGELRIPAGITTIGEGAFKSNTKLTKVIIPGWVTEIQKEAFKSCSGLLELVFEGDANSNLLNIRESAFYSCSKLTELTLPANLGTLEANAFGGTTKLVTVNVTGGEKMVLTNKAFGTTAVAPTYYVVNLTLGANVPLFEVTGVFGDQKLANVVVDPANPNFTSQEGVLFDKNVTEIVYYPTTREGNYDIPSTVTKIGAGVFRNKTGLTSITIRSSVVSIGDNAFYGCTKLTSVVFEDGETTLTIGDNAFRNTGMTQLALPTRLRTLGLYAFAQNSKLTSLTIPEGVTTIGDYAFMNMSKVESISLPSTLTKMGEYTNDTDTKPTKLNVFNNCSALKTITVDEKNTVFAAVDGVLYGKTDGAITDMYLCPIKNSGTNGVITVPDTITTIWDKVFYNNKDLVEVKFSEEQKSDLTVGTWTFYGCTALKKVTLPRGLTNIGTYMFNNTAIESIVIPNTVTYIDSNAFYNCKSLTSVTFEEGGTAELTMYDKATSGSMFYNAPIKSISFPERTSMIGQYLFKEHKTLESVHIPASVQKINTYAFNTCTNLKTVTFAKGSLLKTLGSYSFYKAGIESITLPEGIEELGGETTNGDVFAYSKLKSITIPASVKVVGYWAFYNCADLETVTFASGSQLEAIGNYAFNYCTSLKEIEIPASTERIGNNAFTNCKTLAKVEFEQGSKLTSIGNNAFQSTALTSFAFPESENNIKIGANGGTKLFTSCNSLTSVHLSKSVTNIDEVFTGCSSITNITVAADSENFMGHETLPMILNKNGDTIHYLYGELPAGEFRIPDGITEIAVRAFAGQPNLTKLIIPKAVELIDNYAFTACTALKEIVFEDAANSKLEKIGNYAFQKCSALEKIAIPESVTTLGTYVFSYCSALSEATLPSKITKLGDYMFERCTSLKSLTIPSTVTTLGSYMLQYSGIESLVLPEGLKAVPKYFFSHCENLTGVTLPSTLTTIGTYSFEYCTSLTSITIPEKVTTVDNYAFRSSGLTSVTLPASVKTVGNYTFNGCTALTSVSLNEGLTKIGTNAFQGCEGLTKVVVPSTVTTAGNSSFRDCVNLSEITLPDGLKTLGNYMFNGCTALKSIVLPSALTFIGTYTFQNSGIEEIVIPAGVTCFGTSATACTASSASHLFDGCVNLKKVTLHADFDRIGAYVFTGCTNLTEVLNVDGVTIVGNYAFQNSGIQTLTLPAVETVGTYAFQNGAIKSISLPMVTSIGTNAFDGAAALESVKLNDQLEKFASYVFRNTTALKSIDLPSALTTFGGSYVFAGSGLESITIPANVKYLGSSATSSTATSYAFDGCENLASVTFLGNVVSINSYAFRNCSKLTDVILPDSVTYIGSYAFANTAITEMLIPAKVDTIGGAAFGGCTLLTSIDVAGGNEFYTTDENGVLYETDGTLVCYPAGLSGVATLKEDAILGGYAFYGCDKITGIELPEGIEAIPQYAFRGMTGLKSLIIPETVKTIGTYAFAESGIEEIVIPATVTSLGAASATSYTYTFQNCVNLKKATILCEIESIYGYMFSGCSALETVSVPETVNLVGYGAFKESGVKSFSLDKITTINSYAFQNSGLESLVLPATVQSISSYAFMGCAVKEVTWNYNSEVSYPTKMFGECLNLEKVNLSEDFAVLPTNAFYGCTALKSIKLPAGLEQVATYAFAGSGLESIEIPDGVQFGTTETAYGYTFQDCASLKTVTFLGSVPWINGAMFKNCTALESIVIPEGVTIIGANTFNGCTALKSVAIPSTVTTIGLWAFADCTALTSIVIPEYAVLGGKEVFLNWTEQQTVYVETSEASAAALWIATWQDGCNANIVWNYVTPTTGSDPETQA